MSMPYPLVWRLVWNVKRLCRWYNWRFKFIHLVKSDKVPVDDFKLSVYGLRHTRASYLIHSGIPVDICAKVLGHTVLQLEKTYRHLLYEKRDEGFEAIRKILWEGQFQGQLKSINKKPCI